MSIKKKIEESIFNPDEHDKEYWKNMESKMSKRETNQE